MGAKSESEGAAREPGLPRQLGHLGELCPPSWPPAQWEGGQVSPTLNSCWKTKAKERWGWRPRAAGESRADTGPAADGGAGGNRPERSPQPRTQRLGRSSYRTIRQLPL